MLSSRNEVPSVFPPLVEYLDHKHHPKIPQRLENSLILWGCIISAKHLQVSSTVYQWRWTPRPGLDLHSNYWLSYTCHAHRTEIDNSRRRGQYVYHPWDLLCCQKCHCTSQYRSVPLGIILASHMGVKQPLGNSVTSILLTLRQVEIVNWISVRERD